MLDLWCRYKRFLLCLGCSGQSNTKYFFPLPYTISMPLSSSPSSLGRQPCWVACLLVCVSGAVQRGAVGPRRRGNIIEETKFFCNRLINPPPPSPTSNRIDSLVVFLLSLFLIYKPVETSLWETGSGPNETSTKRVGPSSLVFSQPNPRLKIIKIRAMENLTLGHL